MGADGAGGQPSGPDETLRARVDAVEPSGDYMLRAALVVIHFFLGENRHAQEMVHFLVLL